MSSGVTDDRLTPEARRLLRRARLFGARLGSGAASPEHILLVLLTMTHNTIAHALLSQLSVPAEEIAGELRLRMELPVSSGRGLVELDNASRALVRQAFAEARQMGHHCVGTEHFVAAFLRDERSVLCFQLAKRRIPCQVLLRDVYELFSLREPGPAVPLTQPAMRAMWLGDFPEDVRDDLVVRELVRYTREASPGELDAADFVIEARRKNPASTEELVRYIADYIAYGIRVVRWYSDASTEENE